MENENAKVNQGEIVSPQKIENMDEDTFLEYIESAKNSDVEVQDDEVSDQAESAEETKPYMSFKTKEDLQEYQNQTIGKRLKEIREAGEREKEQLSAVFDLAKARYNTNNDFEAVSRLLEELGTQNHQTSVQRQIDRVNDEINYQRRVDDIKNDWIRQGEALEKIVPDFDLEEAFQNPDFYNCVVNRNMTIAEAYPVLKKKVSRKNISEIGNLSGGIAGHISHDVKSMSEKEFDDYIKKIKNS